MYLRGIPQIKPHQASNTANECVMNVMLATPYTVMLKVVNAINEGVFVIHRIWISVEVRIAHQVKLRITGLRILRLGVKIRAKKRNGVFCIIIIVVSLIASN